MALKTNNGETEKLVTRFVRHAGFTSPTPLQSTVIPLAIQGKDLLIEAEHGDGKTGAMIIPLLTQLRNRHEPSIKALILTGTKKKIPSILNQYKRFAPRNIRRPSITAVGNEDNVRKELRILKKQTDILLGTPNRVIDHIRRNNVELSNVEYAVLDIPERVDEDGFDKDVLYIFSKMRGKQQTIVFSKSTDVASTIESILKRPQLVHRSEWDGHTAEGSTDEEEAMNDKERIANIMSDLKKRVKEQESPDILNHYRKIFRQHVPLHLRGYVSAMFLKEYLGGDGALKMPSTSASTPRSSGSSSSGSSSGTKKRSSGKRDPESQSAAQTADGMKTLFVSIGKNRKVYPKDLIKLFTESGDFAQTDIGSIKILDSYSFVDVPADRSELAIKALDGSEFRGRKITVNNARKRKK